MQSAKLDSTGAPAYFPWFYIFQACVVAFILLTLFGPVFPLYMDAMGLSKSQIGALLAIPHFLAVLSLFFTGVVARHGPKRIFIVMSVVRLCFIAGLLILPWFAHMYGPGAVFTAAAVMIGGFALCRAIGDTGFFPWEKEMLSDRTRGKVYAVNGIVCGIMAFCTSLAAAWMLRHVPGLAGYQVLIATGVVLAVISIWSLTAIGGGRPAPDAGRRLPLAAELLAALRNTNFRHFLAGNGIFLVACGVFPFMPLFLREQLGLTSDRVMILDMSARGGILLASFFWGWSADRFGARPVLASGTLLLLLFPLGMFVLPHHATWLTLALMLLYCICNGMAVQGYSIGLARYLYVDAVPHQTGSSAYVYYSLHYATAGLCSALGPLLAGRLLDWFDPLQRQWLGMYITPFSPLFLMSILLFLLAARIFRGLYSAGAIPTGRFLSMLVQGNPLLAFGSILRYQFASDETERVINTERVGQARNRLATDELLESLSDPSFNVRYEAVLAISRMPADVRLTEAMTAILRSREPELSMAAGWALGRLGDRQAIPALRETLVSEYALLRARSARSLAILRDHESAATIFQALLDEPHDGIRVAYATALGSLRFAPALPEILSLLGRLSDGPMLYETALAAARMLECEKRFTSLWRTGRNNPSDCARPLRKGLANALEQPGFAAQPSAATWRNGLQAIQSSDWPRAFALLDLLADQLPETMISPPARTVLKTCSAGMGSQNGAPRQELLLLYLSVLLERTKHIRPPARRPLPK